jgi:hypothetical protein
LRIADRTVGILIGLILGIAIVAAFVFLGSGDTIDDPSLSGGGTTSAPAQTTTEALPAEP